MEISKLCWIMKIILISIYRNSEILINYMIGSFWMVLKISLRMLILKVMLCVGYFGV